MTREVEVKSWEEFEEKLASLEQKQKNDNRIYQVLFRGQLNSTWGLETTLERSGKFEMKFADYYRLISILQPQIETVTQNRW